MVNDRQADPDEVSPGGCREAAQGQTGTPLRSAIICLRRQTGNVCRLPEVWPSDGAIEVQSLVVRYRVDLDPVLNGISFSIKGAGQRQGIHTAPLPKERPEERPGRRPPVIQHTILHCQGG